MQKPSPVRFLFGRFEVDVLGGKLYENGERAPIQEKPFQLLLAILQGTGSVVTREEAARRLWPETHVQVNQGLNAAIRKVRQVLGDSCDNPRYIETLGRRGYRFIHPVEAIASPEPLVEPVSASLRIAVLPIEDHSGADEHHAQGFSDELSTLLRKYAPKVTVVSNGEVTHRNLRGKAINEIGRELDVEFVVSSCLRLTRNKLRLTAMLFQIDDTQCLWAETHDHEPEQFMKIRTEIANEVAHSLHELIERFEH